MLVVENLGPAILDGGSGPERDGFGNRLTLIGVATLLNGA